jgi:hypothetical protein
MKIFKDRDGREWTIDVTIDSVKRIKSLIGFDLLDLDEGKSLIKLVDDPVTLCDVIYCLVKPQADERQISDVRFGQAMAGDAIEAATDALLADLVDFFPGRKRRLLAKTLAKLKELTGQIMDRAELAIDGDQSEPGGMSSATASPSSAATAAT